MKSRVQRIDILNFKAFRRFTLNLEGRHLLLYGPNGSGKSSLYGAFYTFLQSSRKPTSEVAKYFTPDEPQSLLNIHEQKEAVPRLGQIALTFRNAETNEDSILKISMDVHETQNHSLIKNGDLASDFITYRFFFAFSDFAISQDFNIWPLFEKEILPFCVSTSTPDETPIDSWNMIKSGNANPSKLMGSKAARSYQEFQQNTENFATVLDEIVESISKNAQAFYDEHFSDDDSDKISFTLAVPKDKTTNKPFAPAYNRASKIFTPPQIMFGLQVDGQSISNPQSFLNEAKSTQIALSVRFATSVVKMQESDLKLLVLDDLLLSLDMSNRMYVVEILLGETFANYQKIILTHDRGFFEEVRRMIGTAHTAWCFRTLQGNSKDGIEDKEEKDPIEKATDYLNGHDLEAAALQLRKAAEDTAKSYLKMATGKAAKPGEFHSLSAKLDKARNILLNQLPLQIFKEVCSKVPKSHRGKLVRMNDDDIEADAALTSDEKKLIKQQREKLKKFMTHDGWKPLDAINLLDAIIQMKDRVLNPAAHWSETPLFDAEVRKALTLIDRLEKILLK